MHLKSLEVLQSFGAIVGLSDHTRDATVTIASVALGAKIIEKHFILNREHGGPDAFFSLEPDDFRSMVSAVREAEAALGAPRFGISPDERPSAAFRRSLFVARDVPEGAVLTCDDVRSVRPAHGIDPRHMPSVLGRMARRALAAATPLAWDALGDRLAHVPIELRTAAPDEVAAMRARRESPATPEGSIEFFVASFQGARIGLACLEDRGGHSRELSMSIDPEAQGEGLAAALLSAVEIAARERGDVHISAHIRKDDETMVRAFKNAGYYAFVERRRGDLALLACERRIVPYD
jgi:GNAT superfamily N-acetyltransferase